MANNYGNPVVIAIHFQNDVLHPDSQFHVGTAQTDNYREDVIKSARRLLQSARDKHVPVIHGRIAFQRDHSDLIANCLLFTKVKAAGAMVDGSWGADFYEGFAPQQGEASVTHTRNNVFFGTRLQTMLESLRADTLILAGVATNYSVEHTARHAVDVGYRVVIASDACTTADRALHDASLRTLALLADIRTVAEINEQFV
jgi:biuret amidohydrolase